jgi:YVTN family beta-propeller protein
MALNPSTNLGYVTNDGSNNLSVVDLSTNPPLVIGTVPVTSPWHVALNPTTNRLYVTMTSGGGADVFDTSTTIPTLVDFLPTGNSPADVQVDETTNRVYVDCSTPTAVYVFDGNNDNQLAVIPVGDAAAFPDRMPLNPHTNRLYVSVQLSHVNETVIDTTTNSVVATIPFGGPPDGVAVDVPTNQIYVGELSLPFNLWQIDGNTTQVVSSMVPGPDPLAVAVNSQTRRLYTANKGDNTVSVIDIPSFWAYLPMVPNGSPP